MSDATTAIRETQPVAIPIAGATLHGDLTLPRGARGLVVFAHGSGSSRLSPRNRLVATRLHDAGFATLLFDLLTPQEEAVDAVTATIRFDIEFLATRLSHATEWLAARPEVRDMSLGYFGASTGAAAALVAATRHAGLVGAVVSRGGRPDLAGPYLRQATAPTLLIVGGADHLVIRLNQEALVQLGAETKELVIVPGATHLFEEPGTLERVADLAAAWFRRHLQAPRHPRILVVEDDPTVGALLEQGLREDAFEVERARDGEEALAMAQGADYDLILLDHMLPKKSGIEVTRALRQAGKRTPILMLTARDAPEDIRSSRAAGIDDLLSKPFRFDDLLDRIRALVPGAHPAA
jgi:CheY-like chemotaxis protein/pimeloyl-ACP methyl ester carboxylesterase